MKTTILDLSQDISALAMNVDSVISFNSFIKFLEKKIAAEHTIKKGFYENVLQQFNEYTIKGGTFVASEAPGYNELFNLVFSTLTSAMADESHSLWALSLPSQPLIFYVTDAFYNLIADERTGCLKSNFVNKTSGENLAREKINFVYSLIFETFYNFNPFHAKEEMVQGIPDKTTGLTKYYRLNVDSSFIEIFAKAPLPELQLSVLYNKNNDTIDTDLLYEKLPLSLFRLEGFSVLTFTDVTANYAVEILKDILVDQSVTESDQSMSNVIHSLKTLVENNNINFGLMPVLKVNNKLVFDSGACINSIIANHSISGDNGQVFLSLVEQYLEEPKNYFIRSVSMAVSEKKKKHIDILINQGIEAYALLPIYYNNKIAGLLEIYSKEENSITENSLEKLKAALPLLAQLMQNKIDEFNNSITSIIRDKFTAMQPAVQWKFNEVAWHYLQNNNSDKSGSGNIEPVYFGNVYPLYGAIDIRNSTIERNEALRADFKVHFDLLIALLLRLRDELKLNMLDQLLFKCQKWKNAMEDITLDINEQKINNFLQLEVKSLLHHFKETSPLVEKLINPYLQAIDEEKGVAYKNIRQLETSMQTINQAISNYLDLFKKEIQLSYPCYFEKFRTDGIEYDIYIGQSIAPGQPFNSIYLNNIRLWQLTSMAAIAKMMRSIVEQLPRVLQTTQLIFIHSNTIDISFRPDEKRFDVEGSYNIRYQVIKKRIDKVHVKSTGERLTQPNKIALIYSNRKESLEYIEHIHYLQEKDILEKEIEELELEELQGVSGLKAIRVSVK